MPKKVKTVIAICAGILFFTVWMNYTGNAQALDAFIGVLGALCIGFFIRLRLLSD